MNIKPVISSFDRLHRDADAAGWHDLAKIYKQARDRLIADETAWNAYDAAFRLSMPKRKGDYNV
jgi:hypothetical protein